MTYRTLLEKLKKLSDEQLDMDVSVYLRAYDEFYPVSSMKVTIENDIFDKDHPFLTVK